MGHAGGIHSIVHTSLGLSLHQSLYPHLYRVTSSSAKHYWET